MAVLRTGELARLANVNVETLRFYERKGLLPRPPRRQSGYREYPTDAVKAVRFVKRAQQLAFSLKEIHELLALRIDAAMPCAEVKNRAETKIADIEKKINALQQIKKALKKLTAACNGRGLASECPILEALEEGGSCCDRGRSEARLEHDNGRKQ